MMENSNVSGVVSLNNQANTVIMYFSVKFVLFYLLGKCPLAPGASHILEWLTNSTKWLYILHIQSGMKNMVTS